MKAERFEEKHLETLREWWDQRGVLGVADEDILSDVGGVITDGESILMIGFLYPVEGRKVAFLEGVAGRPGNTPAESRQAGRLFSVFMLGQAHKLGAKYVYSHVGDPRMIPEMEAVGFEVYSETGALMQIKVA